MNNPVIAKKAPIVAAVEGGIEYWYCTCGRSDTQPFCDGSHKGTEFTPKSYTTSIDSEVHFCGCKHTECPPLCDGTHLKL